MSHVECYVRLTVRGCRHVVARTEERMSTRKRLWTLAAVALCVGFGAALSASAAPTSSQQDGTLAIIPAVAANPPSRPS